MYIGLSKSLGNGFRIGIGTRIGNSKRKGPTQADIAKLEKAQFLSNIEEESNRSLEEFLVNHNIDPSYAAKKKLDIDAILGVGQAAPQYIQLRDRLGEINETINKIHYGSSLTAKKRDRLVDLLFELRALVNNSGPGLNHIAEEVAKQSAKICIISFSIIFSIFTLLLVSFMLLEVPTDSNENHWLTGIAATGLVVVIIYLPLHLIIYLYAKLKYRKRVRAKMKEMHGV